MNLRDAEPIRGQHFVSGSWCFLFSKLWKWKVWIPNWRRTFGQITILLCRYKSSPEEVAAACDVTFAMLADPECAVRMFFFFWNIIVQFVVLTSEVQLRCSIFQVEVACGKNGAVSGMGPGKGYYLLVFPYADPFSACRWISRKLHYVI